MCRSRDGGPVVEMDELLDGEGAGLTRQAAVLIMGPGSLGLAPAIACQRRPRSRVLRCREALRLRPRTVVDPDVPGVFDPGAEMGCEVGCEVEVEGGIVEQRRALLG